MKVKHCNGAERSIAWAFLFLLLLFCTEDGRAQASNSYQEGNVVSVKSWKSGESKMPEQVLNVNLLSDVAQYEFDVLSASDKGRRFRLSLRQGVENTVRSPGLPCWIADFREITKDNVSIANQVGHNLLSVEGPGVGDNFPREEWAGYLCPVEKPNRALDGLFYPMRAERRFLIEGFVLSLQVTDYQLDKERKKLNHVDLRIVFSNQ